MEKTAKPKRNFKTFVHLVSYFKKDIYFLILVFILVIYTSFAQIYGTYMLKDIIKYGVQEANFDYVVKNTSIMALIYLFGVLANFTYTQIMVRLSQRLIYRLRSDIEKKILALPLSYFDKHPVGEIMNYFTNDVDTTVNALNQSFANIVFSFCNIVGTLLGMFMISTQLSLIALFIISITIFFIVLNSYKARKYFRLQQVSLSKVNSKVEEDLRGIKVNKAFLHEDESFLSFDTENKAWQKDATNAAFRTNLNTPFIISLSYLNFALCSVVGIIMIGKGMLDGGIASLTPFLIYVRQAGSPFNMFTTHLNNILTALAGSERIFNFLNEKEEKERDLGTITLIKENNINYWKKDDNTLLPLKGEIVFNHVKFGYKPEKLTLNDVSFYANAGEKIAFVGSTGAGKTTIISLISRFYEINEGEITYDGINIKDIKIESLRRAMSLVTQETHLFTDTIKNNIIYPRRHSTEEEIETASKISGADHFISKLENGYDTELVDGGINLSEGERQLLSLTRAAISKPPLLILDEATSNIDTRTEKLIEKSMDKLMENRTVLVIAHRLSTVRNSTAILVLDHGKIIERGNHEDLLALKGRYYSLYKGIIELE